MGPYERRRDRALTLAGAAVGSVRPQCPERHDDPTVPWMLHQRVGPPLPYSRQARRAAERRELEDRPLSSDLRAMLSQRPGVGVGLRIRRGFYLWWGRQ